MTVEGTISIGGFETWYGIVGGPAGPHSRKLSVRVWTCYPPLG